VELRDETTQVRLIDAACVVRRSDGACCSLIPLTTVAEGVTTGGLLYPLRGEDLTVGSTRGISNEIIGEEGTVRIRGGLLLVVQTSI
jgi:thiamine pyrophosphokinase